MTCEQTLEGEKEVRGHRIPCLLLESHAVTPEGVVSLWDAVQARSLTQSVALMPRTCGLPKAA